MKQPQFATSLLALLFAPLLAVVIAYPTAAQYDVMAPVIMNLTFSPKIVDTANGDQAITATAHITDDLSGVDHVDVLIAPDALAVGQRRFFTFDATTRISGDALDGMYQVAFILPRYSADGQWSVERIDSNDKIGNYMPFFPASTCADYPTGKCIDSSNELHFVNGFSRRLYLPAVERR